MRVTRLLVGPSLVLAVSACGPEVPVVRQLPVDSLITLEAPRPAPDAYLAEFEQRLLDAESVNLDFELTAEGAVEAQLQGRFAVNPSGHAQLTAIGRFGGRGVDVVLEAEGGILEYGDIEDPREADLPPRLRDAMLVGLARMGLFHNIARLVGNTVPDQANGGVARWVTVRDVVYDGETTVAFSVLVAAEAYGRASVEFDEEGMLVTRRHVIGGTEGEIRVVETYSSMTIGVR